MRIVVLTGSPHRHGTTARLADEFIRGAAETGHTVSRFDAAFMSIHPCTGCDECRRNGGKCVFDDDMAAVLPRLLEADIVTFVTPTYYHGATAQLTALIDRFYSINAELRASAKGGVLLAASADSTEWVLSGVKATYEANMKYLHWIDRGQVLASGCGAPGALDGTGFPAAAFALGRSL